MRFSLTSFSLFSLLLCRLCHAGDSIDFKVRIQPRADLGHISSDNRIGHDLYVRRCRVELLGRPTNEIYYMLVVSSDQLGKRGYTNVAQVIYAFVNYRLSENIDLRAGRLKIPFSRGGWVSSSRILLIERSRTVSTMVTALGAHVTPQIALQGRLKEGTISCNLAIIDGLEQGDADSKFTGATVSDSNNPGLVARVEISPKGWTEARKSESHVGIGRHLTLGINTAFQNEIAFNGQKEDRSLFGCDFSFHQRGLTLQIEYLRVSRNGSVNLAPAGWYGQIGTYLAGYRLEPTARFERFSSALPNGNNTTTDYTVGLNWYQIGHDLKFMANLIHTRHQSVIREIDDPSKSTLLRLHSQLYF